MRKAGAISVGLVLAVSPGIAQVAASSKTSTVPTVDAAKSIPQIPDATKAGAPETSSGDQVTAKVLGFRSAQFGMDEAAVRAAAMKDFNVPASAIHETQNLGERTDMLTVRVPEVLPGGGMSDVAYAFGYKSKKLTQVSVVWSKGTDKAITPEQLLADSEALREYFLSSGYDPKTLVTNSPVRDGILLFRGTDAGGHTTAMMLHGTTTAGADKTTQTFVPNALLLFYIADAKTPDIFKLQAGRF